MEDVKKMKVQVRGRRRRRGCWIELELHSNRVHVRISNLDPNLIDYSRRV